MHASHVASYYAARQRDLAVQPELVGKYHTDVCIVGGGLAGLTCALEALKLGRRVAVLEAELTGWGASGRNGGFVSAGFAAGMDEVEKRVGLDDARSLYKLSAGGVQYIHQMIEREAAGHIVQGRGWLKVQRHDNAGALKARQERMARNYNVELGFLDRPQLKRFLQSDRYFCALHDPSPFHIDPLAYADLLKQKIMRLGGKIFEQSPALSLKGVGAGWRVNTPLGCVHSESVVLATSAYGVLNGVWPQVDKAMQPVATYVVTSASMGPELGEVIRFNGCIADTRRAGDYYRIVEGNRLLWGGRITTRRTEPALLAEMLKEQILEIYPQLGDFHVEFAWSGLMGYSRHKMPIVGELRPGLWALTGFGGHGLNTSAMGGALVAKGLATGDDRWRLLAQFGHPWAGGAAGRAAVQMEYYRLQALDWFEEKRAMLRSR
ncbi:NAD(P)/FAD-dependent oxidoreductase [Polycladidibacter hongkongensis]|uniref:NAD(P)/FAD-dependent oxidoreductase n=1 Tax=Polycladidibacter hongkongensis TaxID=1647556 RepID=UPI00082E2332|nr:FAD-dependent oxidoreductase [Pseudovibrio hongkongensis]